MIKKIPFNRFYKLFNFTSILLIAVSVFLLLFKGLNFGVDFKGGTLIELKTTDKSIKITDIQLDKKTGGKSGEYKRSDLKSSNQ